MLTTSLILTVVLASSSPSSAQPVISAVTANSDTVGLYEKLELTVDLTASYTNPFDPGDVDLRAVFTSPTLERWSVNGFWDGNGWRIRFAAGDMGSWNHTVYLGDGTGQDSTDGSFECRPSPHRGWLRVSPDDGHFLQHDDGTPFFGIGQCRCWSLDDVPGILDDMQEHGMNTLVYWMPSWDNALVTLATGYDQYDMDHAAEIDTVVNSCEAHDICLALTIWNHDELRGAGHPWPRKYFDEYNPFHDLTDATGFMTDSTSWAYQEKLYRYIIARWGYSRAIGLWHTVCEIDGTTNSYNNDAATDPWHIKIKDYFTGNDPFGHPATASKSADGSVWNWPAGFGIMDCPQAHVYGDGEGISSAIASRTQTMWSGYNKPNFIGEFGASYGTAPTVKHLHDGIWAGLAAGGAIAPLDWNDGGDWGDLTPEMYDQQQNLADFVFGLPMARLSLSPLSLSIDAEFNAWGMAGDRVGYFWIQDASPGEINAGATLTVSGLTGGQWSFAWYDTWSGEFLPDRAMEAAVGGSIATIVPDFTDDIACRFHRAGEIGQRVVHLGPIGDVTTWPGTPYRWKDIADHIYDQSYQDTFTYDQPRVTVAFDPYGQTFRGTLQGYGLKPNFAYQMKLVGKPNGLWGLEADDESNEHIGYQGRWWREQPDPGNSNDADYEAHQDDSSYIFVGYLLFDYFATDEYGHVEKGFQLNGSYHVLWNTVLNSREPGPNDSPITGHTVRAAGYHPAYDTAHAPAEVGLYAEWEPGRDLPGEVTLPAWMYHLQFILTEESFHQSGIGGYWAGAMGCDTLLFSIPDTASSPVITAILPDVGSMHLRLEWTAVPDAVFNVYRDTSHDFLPSVPLATGLVGTTYTDTAANWLGHSGRSYYYAVTAVAGGKESSPSGRVGEFDTELFNVN